MNALQGRNFDELAVGSRQYQELEALERENDALWMENQNLRQSVQRLQILAIQKERDAEEAYTCMRLLLDLLPKGEWRKKAQRAMAFLMQKQQRLLQKSGYLQNNQFYSFYPELFDGYDGGRGYEYGGYKQTNSGNQRKRTLFRG